MTGYRDFAALEGVRIRGTVLVLPGRGESQAGYGRFGARLAADAYQVRVLPPPADADQVRVLASPADADADQVRVLASPAEVDPLRVHGPLASDLSAAVSHAAAVLSEALDTIDLVRPLMLVGADTGAAVIAALVARSSPEKAWWPDAVVLAGLPGYDGRQGGGWDEELDVRTHCPVHRGVLTDDPAVVPGSLAEAVPAALLDAAYGSTADVPHLLLTGDADPLADRAELTRLAKSLPQARLAVVRGGHHDVLNDLQHRSVAAEIVTFLEAVRGGLPPVPLVEVVATTW
jgi:pimeloyl-ACP methyl ester carboxylesterase